MKQLKSLKTKLIRINRKNWIFGTLVSNDCKKGCALGHAIRQINHCSWKKVRYIVNYVSSNYTATEEIKGVTGQLIIQSKIEFINDFWDFKPKLSKTKEAALIKEFKRFGLELEFYN